MSDQIYSIVADFPSGLFNDELYGEILEQLPTVVAVSTDDDVVTISFSTVLSPTEITTLDSIVAAHVPVTYVSYAAKSISPTTSVISTTKYLRIATFIFSGSKTSMLKNIKILSYKDTDVTSFDVRIFDGTNKKTLATENFTNNSLNINVLDTFVNIPKLEAVLEILVKKNGGTNNIYCNEIVAEYTKL